VRTLVASLLVVAALAAALVGWFSAGWSGVRATEAELRAAPAREAEAAARALTAELVTRLELLRGSEARRPYYHYQSLYHDPKIAAEGLAVAPSPLASGPDDPLVRGHFQLRSKGVAWEVTMPTINDDIPELNTVNFASDDALRAELAAVAPAIVAAASGPAIALPTLVASNADDGRSTKPRPPRGPAIGRDTSGAGSAGAGTGSGSMAVAVGSSTDTATSAAAVARVDEVQTQQQNDVELIQLSPDQYVQNAYSNNAYQQALDNQRAIDPDELAQQRRKPNSNPRRNPPAQQRATPTPQAVNPQMTPPQSQRVDPPKPQPTPPPQPQAQAVEPPAPQPQAQAVSPPTPAPATSPTATATATPTPTATPAPAPRPRRRAPKPEPKPPAPITIAVAPLEWHETKVGDRDVLTALRRVDTPDGTLTQGLVVDTDAVAAWLADRHPGARLVAATEAARPNTALADVPWGGWRVEMPFDGLTGMAASIASVRSAFWGRFLPVAALASLCGLLVVVVVARAERLAKARSRFAAAAAHELRTPLAGLQLYGDMLADGLGDPRKAQQYAHRISEEASRLGRVVANVLGFSQLERGDLSVQARDGDAAVAARDVIERARPALDRAKVEIDVDLPESLPARFDPDALARILGNLLDNAEKYSRGGDERRVSLRGARTGDKVELTVTDSGPGVADGARLFVPFSRGVGTDGPAGLGLGLALSRSLARSMGGDLSHAAGSTFVVTLPAA
jgi:signal transduction histidine kinase